MELLGGLLRDARLHREFSFKPVTGELERLISESGNGGSSLSEQVTKILVSSLHSVAGLAADKDVVRALCSGDRLFLIQQLEAIIDPSPKWLTSPCQACDELIQFQLLPGTLPVKSAGNTYPKCSITLTLGDVEVRVPTGADEEWLARKARGEGDETNSINLLLKRILTMQSDCVAVDLLTDDDKELIDQTLDEMSPQPGHSASIECPHCKYRQVIPIDSYSWITREAHGLDEKIHMLAFHYHWSEAEILMLPRSRRQRYIKLIERNLGKYQAEDFMRQMAKSQGRVV